MQYFSFCVWVIPVSIIISLTRLIHAVTYGRICFFLKVKCYSLVCACVCAAFSLSIHLSVDMEVGWSHVLAVGTIQFSFSAAHLILWMREGEKEEGHSGSWSWSGSVSWIRQLNGRLKPKNRGLLNSCPSLLQQTAINKANQALGMISQSTDLSCLPPQSLKIFTFRNL